ncbi:MAG TPA: UDP-N-acetylmuramoyl-tripeptide--D-alanyl-D-alanine ligase [Rhodanobacteraceae bacterium]
MLNFKLSEVAMWVHGQMTGADVPVAGVSTDSRAVRKGDLFVALPGEYHDGHDHVAAAAMAGASAAMVARQVASDVPQVLVADTQAALGDLASAVRARRHAQVVGITGSNGKTTVKTLTAAILSRHGRTHVTQGNFNNEIGLPLTLLAMPAASEYAVLEMGAGKPGDIAYLAGIARPEVALVNNIAPAHLERMGSLEGIAETKGAMYTALPAGGVAIINVDDAFAGFFAGLAGTRRIVRFGLEQTADVRADVHSMDVRGSRFTLVTPAGQAEVTMPLPGRHNVANALAATAIAHALQAPLATIVDGLEHVEAVAGRLVARAMPGGWTLIDDSYNANPGSVAAAIDALMLAPGERWLVLGNIAELGPTAPALHARLGELARQRGIDCLYTVGNMAREAAQAFGDQACHFDDRDALVKALRGDLHAGVTCLVKGSHSSAMDRVVAALTDGGDDRAA